MRLLEATSGRIRCKSSFSKTLETARIILEWILEKYDRVAWTGLIWLRIRNIG
jgi:hypothetical protein